MTCDRITTAARELAGISQGEMRRWVRFWGMCDCRVLFAEGGAMPQFCAAEYVKE